MTSTRSGAAGFGRNSAKAPTRCARTAGRLAKAAKTTLGGRRAEAMAADYAAQRLALRSRGDGGLLAIKLRRRERSRHQGRASALRALARSLGPTFSGTDCPHPGVDPGKADYRRRRGARHVCGLRRWPALRRRSDLAGAPGGQGFRVRMSHRIAPFPTVTATAKPVASPAHGACSGKPDAEDFRAGNRFEQPDRRRF